MAQARGRRGGTGRRATPPSRASENTDRLCPAYRSPRAVAVFVTVVLLGAGADLASKHYAFAALIDSPARAVEVIPGFLRLTLSTNRGIVFGVKVPASMVLAATAAAMGVVIFLFASSPSRSWGLHTALAMVLGGSLGNLYDRLFACVWFPGEPAGRVRQVRDFIEVDLQFTTWPIFNVADALLVVGVGLIFLHLLRDWRAGRT